MLFTTTCSLIENLKKRKKMMKTTLVIAAAFCSTVGFASDQSLSELSYPSIGHVDQIGSFYLKEEEKIYLKKNLAIEGFNKSIQEFLDLKNKKGSSQKVIEFYDLMICQIATTINLFNAMSLVEPNDAIRKAYSSSYQEIKENVIKVFSDKKELYELLSDVQQKEKNKPTLNKEASFYLKQILNEMKLDGLHLETKKREELKNTKISLTKLSDEFGRNIQEDNSFVVFKKEELTGLSSEFIDQLEKEGELGCRLTCDYPTYFYVMKSAENKDVRKALYRAFMNRAYPRNYPVLEQMIEKRNELANLLSFSSYSSMQLSNEMVKNPSRAEDFLNNLSSKSIEKQKKEIEEIKASFPDLIDEKEKKLEPWDMLYAQEKLMQTKYSVDEDLVKEYFPLNKTVDGLINIYERFFGLTITSKPIEGLWDPEVRVLEIKEKNSLKVYGYILLDLFPRANKYSHACHATIIGGLERGRDVSTTSLSLVIANFPKATPSKPSLMNLSDARTFFHEFGHAIHAVLGRTEFFGTSGTNVKVDFVELPSQMLEEWLWDKEILKMISSHYKSSEKMPDELISKILQSRQAFSGTFIGRQVLLSKFSLECFGARTQKNLDELFRQIHSSLHLSYSYDPASHFAASFGHLDEYGARYYGYLWSRVFALDVFEQIKKEGLLNEKVGKRYISTILGKGGSDDPENLLRSFLGRDPSDQPFLKNYGM